MRFLFPSLLILLAGITGVLADGPNSSKPTLKSHDWEEINFAPPDRIAHPFFSVRPDDQNKGLAFSIEFTCQAAKKDHFVSAQLYRENGETVEPDSGNLANPGETPRTVNPIMPGQAEPENTEWSADAIFPWGKNTLEAAWIEVTMGPEKYWLELPYGFDRNPKDPLPPAQAGAAPHLPAAMKTLTDHDHVVSWQGVAYDLGKIQYGWDLSFTQSNPGDGKCEVCLIARNARKKIDLFSPRTAVQAFTPEGDTIGSACSGLRFDDDGFRRDSFDLYRCPCDENVRTWGRIEVTVDKKTYRAVIPSSLYEFEHGHAPSD